MICTICSNMLKYASICTNMQQYASILKGEALFSRSTTSLCGHMTTIPLSYLAYGLLVLMGQATLVPTSHLSLVSPFRPSASPHNRSTHPIPMHDYVLIEIEPPSSTASGLLLTPHGSDPTRGRVLATGPGMHHPITAKHIPMSVHAGDIVLFVNINGQNLMQGNKKHVLLHQSNIILKVNKSDAATATHCLPNTLLVRPIDAQLPSGLLSSSTSSTIATVISAGDYIHEASGTSRPKPIDVGDKVVLGNKNSGVPVKLRGENYIVIRYDDVIAKEM